jgi:hypothetical protein
MRTPSAGEERGREMEGSVQATGVNRARQAYKVMLVAHPDACRVCRNLQGRIFDPVAAPPLPLEECLTPPCRCRYERYDARSVVSRLLNAGVEAVREQRLEEARELLYQVIDLDERNERAWLWLSGVVTGVDERMVCLESVLSINPHHELAREGLRYLQRQRRELGTGQSTARKIRAARDAIEHLKASQPKVSTLKEVPPVPMGVSGELMPTRPTAGLQLPARPARREEERPQSAMSFALVFLCVLFAVLLLVMIGAALVAAAAFLR